MANNYYHAFTAHFSFVVVLIFMAVMVAAYFIGRKSVRLVPRRTPKKRPADAINVPKYDKAKARKLASMFRKAADKAEYENTAVICFRSNTFDVIIAAIGTLIVSWSFMNEHYVGLVQWCINHLTASDSAAWGDITAIMIVSFISCAIFGITYLIVRLGQIHKATYYANQFTAEHVRPIFNERRSVGYFVSVLIFCIKEEAKEKKAKVEAKKETYELKNADIA